MFFSTASWNSGGGGRSTARNKNGDVNVLISVQRGSLMIQRRNEKLGTCLCQYQKGVLRYLERLTEQELAAFPFSARPERRRR